MIKQIHDYFKQFEQKKKNYLFAQSFEELRDRLNRIAGSFLFVDYGEITFQGNNIRSLQGTLRLAVTYAEKLSPSTLDDARIDSAQNTLDRIAAIYSQLATDVDTSGRFPYADRQGILSAEIVPFVASELNAYGWTLLLDCTSPDPLNIRPRE